MARQPAPAHPEPPARLERSTRQRRAIREVFEAADRPLSPEEVVDAASRHGEGVSLATVYRSIRLFVDEGWLSMVALPSIGTLYEVAGKEHHHHFSCTRCRRVYELEGCFSAERMALPPGFHALAHDLTVYGICGECESAPPAKRTGRRR